MRDDFHDTYNGIERKDGKIITAPPMTYFQPIFKREVAAEGEKGRNDGGRVG